MSDNQELKEIAGRDYQYGFVTDIESESFPPGLDEEVIRKLSAIKGEPQWLTDWRLKATGQVTFRSAMNSGIRSISLGSRSTLVTPTISTGLPR